MRKMDWRKFYGDEPIQPTSVEKYFLDNGRTLETRQMSGYRQSRSIERDFFLCNKSIVEGGVLMSDTSITSISTDIGFGSALANVISWSLHKSIIWACIHGFFSGFYVIYYAVTSRKVLKIIG